MMIDLGCLIRFGLIRTDFEWFWVDLGWFQVDLGWFRVDFIWFRVDMKLMWKRIQMTKYGQSSQKIKVSRMRKWDKLVWRSDEVVDANHFLASTATLSFEMLFWLPSLQLNCLLYKCARLQLIEPSYQSLNQLQPQVGDEFWQITLIIIMTPLQDVSRFDFYSTIQPYTKLCNIIWCLSYKF